MLKHKQKFATVPTHIAFIMDGNRRWATRRGLNKMLGHKQGGVALKNIVGVLSKIEGIKYASFFGFSTENWSREQKEIDFIFDVAYNLLVENEDNFTKDNIKFVVLGDLSRFPQKLQDVMKRTIQKTQNNTGLVVNLAMNYGGRADIVYAVNKLIESGQRKVTVEDISQNLYSYPSPDIDFLIRTSGEMRVSNFMLFQMAYSELYFTKVCWPAFDKKQLYKALTAFSKRNRRFGGK